jgi:hypothetical protein
MNLVHSQSIRIERRNVYAHGIVNRFGDWYTIISKCANLTEAREAAKKLRARTNRDESEFRIVKRETTEKVVR